MVRKRRWLVPVLAGVCLLAIIVVVTRHNSLSLHGRSLRVWALECAAGDTNAIAVLRSEDSVAVPGLIELLHSQDSLLQRTSLALAPKLPRRMRRTVFKVAGQPRAASVRNAAAVSLGRLGPQAEAAVPALMEALHDPEPQVRWDSATALAQIGKAAIPALTEALGDKSPGVRQAAAFAFGQMGPEAEGGLPALIETLADTNADVRTSTAYSLAMIGFPPMLSLSNLIDHGTTNARQAAVTTLLRFNKSLRQMVRPLVKMAHAEQPESRRQALEALGVLRIGDNASMETLIEALKDPMPEVRLAAIKSLNLVIWRAEPAVPALITCLQDESPAVREWAARTLGNIGPRAAVAVPELKRLAQDNENLRAAANEALGKIER